MKVNLLNAGYKKNAEFYDSFLRDSLRADGFISDKTVSLPDMDNFPIYFGHYTKKDDPHTLLDLIIFFQENFIHLDMDVYMNELILHSLIVTKMRSYILDLYPKIYEGQNYFETIVTRSFDWENYLYKAAIIAKYVTENVPEDEHQEYFQLILNNLDIFNYIIKSKIFRNSDFFIKFFNIVKERDLSSALKSQIKNNNNPKSDIRVGRMVILEFSNAYPALLSPLLPQEEFNIHFEKFLSYYY